MSQSTILVLDPHRELADMAGEVLSSRGYTVAVAERFEVALELLSSTPSIRVAVCHATLPSEDEEGGAPILLELARHPHIALVVISSRPFEEVGGIPPGAFRLAKPFGAGELLNAVGEAIETTATSGPR